MRQDHKIISISCNSDFLKTIKKQADENQLTVSAYLRSLVKEPKQKEPKQKEPKQKEPKQKEPKEEPQKEEPPIKNLPPGTPSWLTRNGKVYYQKIIKENGMPDSPMHAEQIAIIADSYSIYVESQRSSEKHRYASLILRLSKELGLLKNNKIIEKDELDEFLND